jgi:hypothetical protein
MNSCICYFTNNLTISSCSINITRKVHTMYCDFTSIRFMRSIFYIYDWIYPILFFANYIGHFFHTYPSVCCINIDARFLLEPLYATRFASSPPHEMYSYSIMFSQRTVRGKFTILFSCKFMDRPLWVSTYST